MEANLRSWWAAMRMPALVMVLVVSASAVAPGAVADGVAGNVFVGGVRVQDEIALVSTRMLCGSCDPETQRTGTIFESYAICDDVGNRSWHSSSLDDFVSFDPSVRTIIFVHGNRITPSDAKREGLAVYRQLANYLGDGERIRFVIYSWPSSSIGGLLRDIRAKAARTGPAGCQLAWFLDQMPAETPVTLVGFSLGARIITGGLHILGGGNLGWCSLPERVHPDRSPVNVVLLGAAVHAHWLGDGQYHGLAMTQVNRMLTVNSCQDIAMRYYRFIERHGRAQGMGLRGPTRVSPEHAARIERRGVSRYTGSEHNLFRHLCAPGVVGQIAEYASSAPAVAAPAL